MELYERFSNHVKELCSATRYKLYQHPALENETRLQRIDTMFDSLHDVISKAKQPKSDVECRHQSGIGPGVLSFPPKLDGTSFKSPSDALMLEGLTQRYELFLFPILNTQLVDTED
jgi:hypothetical protein